MSHATPQWLCHRLMGYKVLGSLLRTGSDPQRGFKTLWVDVRPIYPFLSYKHLTGGGWGRREIFTCPYPPNVQARQPQESPV